MRNEKTNPIFAALESKSNQELKALAISLISSTEEGATLSFACALTLLEERLSPEEYYAMENDIITSQEI
jgi:hypothetical protein